MLFVLSGALALVGIAGLVHTVFDPAAWVCLGTASPFALLAFHQHHWS